MKPRAPTLARTAAAAVAGLALVPPALANVAVPSTVTVGPRQEWRLPASMNLTITDAGEINAPTDWTQAGRIVLEGRAVNDGLLRSGFSFGSMGLEVSGTLENRSLAEAMRLVLDGPAGSAQTLINREALLVGWHEAPPGGSFMNGGDPSFERVGLFVGVGARLFNPSGLLANHGNTVLHGVLVNGATLRVNPHPQMFLNQAVYAQKMSILGKGGSAGQLVNTGRLEVEGEVDTRITGGSLTNLAGGVVSHNLGWIWVEEGGRLDNQGSMVVTDANVVIGASGMLGNRGRLALSGQGRLWLYADTVNSGQLIVGPKAALILSEASLHNLGRLTVEGLVTDLTGRPSESLVNEGVLRLEPGGKIAVEQVINHGSGELFVDGKVTGTVTVAGGSLFGFGVIDGKVIVRGFNPQTEANCHAAGWACVKPGNSPGRLTVEGDMSFEASSLLELEVERSRKGEGLSWDELVVQGLDFAKGTLTRVVLGQGVSSPEPVTLPLVHCLGGLGACDCNGASFAGLGGPGGKLVANADGGLDFVFGGAFGSAVAAVPEPGTWVLMVVDLGAVLRCARQRAATHADGHFDSSFKELS